MNLRLEIQELFVDAQALERPQTLDLWAEHLRQRFLYEKELRRLRRVRRERRLARVPQLGAVSCAACRVRLSHEHVLIEHVRKRCRK